MPVSVTPVVERIARAIVGQRLSANADGGDLSAASAVDMEWEDHIDDAFAVLRTMREPDPEMVAVGDTEVWTRMISAALSERV